MTVSGTRERSYTFLRFGSSMCCVRTPTPARTQYDLPGPIVAIVKLESTMAIY